MKVEVLDRVETGWWDDLVRSHAQGTIYQTSRYAEFARRYYGARPFFLLARDNGAVAGQLLVFDMGRFPDRDAARPWRTRLKAPLNRLLRAFRWYDGPLVFEPADPAVVLAALLAETDALAGRHRVAQLAHGALPAVPGAKSPPVPTGFEQTEWGTFLIDLSQGTDVCWRRLKGGAARSAVRRAMKLGVRVIDATDRVTALAQCERAHSTAHRLAAWPEVFWSTLRDVLGPHGYRVLAAEHEERLVAFVPLLVFGRTMHLLKPVQDPRCQEERIPAGDLLMWEAIRLGQALGLVRFDLSGVAPTPSSEAERGIRFFKSKWGGEYVPYPILRRRYRRWLP